MLQKRRPDVCGMLGGPMPPVVSAPNPDRLIKSGVRVLDILEWFSDNRRPAIALDIAEALEIPTSSVSDLLKSLAETGYLLFDAEKKTYFPSPRVMRLSRALLPFSLDPQGLIGMMRKVQEASGECVTISAQNGTHMQFVSFLPTPGVDIDAAQEGLKFPIIGSASGCAILALKSDAEVISVVRKASVGKTPQERQALVQLVLDHVRKARKAGYAVSFLDPLPEAMSVAIAMPETIASVPLALCIGGLKSNLNHRVKDMADLMKRISADYV